MLLPFLAINCSCVALCDVCHVRSADIEKHLTLEEHLLSDVLFDFVTKRVIKIVLHTNMPGHYDFTIYARCEFRVTFDGSEPTVITTSSKFNDICGVFTDASGEYEEPQPVVVSRNTQEDRNPFGSTFCYGTDQIVVEVMDNGHIAAVTLFD
ncbi:hypothetical protein Y032_0096g2882 [Ancylostoma ceylanicum]|uniref:ZP domain-containing protein n=1 Tax=Ancylostoma ceylanicum TaxID=53326 RepID=A0A016TJX4_9BILA|nr:hypothetical protein Y032_0096g2882 [Ancylostoma ceylanicum]